MTPAENGEKPGRGWYGRADLAGLLDVSEVQFDRLYAKLAPADGTKREKRRVWYHGRKLLDAWLRSELAKAQPADADADPLMAGGEGKSKNLEEYRGYRAGQERIKLALMERTVIPRDQLEPALAALAGTLRRAGESIQRQWGTEAAAAAADAAVRRAGDRHPDRPVRRAEVPRRPPALQRAVVRGPRLRPLAPQRGDRAAAERQDAHCFVIPDAVPPVRGGRDGPVRVPSLDMVKDKWEEDLLPAIEASSRYRDLLPRRGEGSRGGNVESRVQFQNGATLRFMTGGGGDKAGPGSPAACSS
jgi:hypothetical protein